MAARITITGKISQDPVLETVHVDGAPRSVCRLNVGYTINRGRNDRNFIEVTAWGDAAENHARYLTKGSLVRIDGELDHQTWQTSDGANRSKHSIVNPDIEYLSPRTNTDPAPARSGAEPF